MRFIPTFSGSCFIGDIVIWIASNWIDSHSCWLTYLDLLDSSLFAYEKEPPGNLFLEPTYFMLTEPNA